MLGVQSGEEGAATTVETGDTGVLGQAFGRMVTKSGTVVERSYIVVGDDVNTANYPAAVTAAADQIEQRAGEVIDRCPSTQIAVAGYAQGAAAAAVFAERAGETGHESPRRRSRGSRCWPTLHDEPQLVLCPAPTKRKFRPLQSVRTAPRCRRSS
ncbi:cutinase family protein [Nocardia sp. MW-W600-9]